MTEEDKNLLLVNLVSRGVPMAKAREKAFGKAAPETPEPVKEAPNKEEAPEMSADEEREELVKALAALGVKAHPNAKNETLKQKLEEASADSNEEML